MTTLRPSALAALVEQLVRGHGEPVALARLEAELEHRGVNVAGLPAALASPRLRLVRALDESVRVVVADADSVGTI